MRLPILLALLLATTAAAAQNPAPPGRFDYFVLSLSWSPSYCGSRAGQTDGEQCGAARPLGFVVHGLWPQHAKGGYPAECAAPAPLPAELVETMLPIMPSRKLVQHEWRKHGTCLGGGPEEYFARARAAFEAVRIPVFLERPARPVTLAIDEVERLFIVANPGLTPDAVALTCRGRFAAEIRICLDKDLKFRSCGDMVRDRCKGAAVFPASR